jgi:hypothetical protein
MTMAKKYDGKWHITGDHASVEAEGARDMPVAVLQWAPFMLQPGMNEDLLLTASAGLQRVFLSAQKGFVRRQLCRASDGSYVDLVWWDSLEAAGAAMKNAASNPACSAFFALIARPAKSSAGTLHLQPVAEYSKSEIQPSGPGRTQGEHKH